MSLQPGSTIPASSVSLAEPSTPPDNVRVTLYYGINWGYTESDPQQAVLAVWYAQDGTWHGEQHATAEQIQSAAASSPGAPSWSPDGRSALQLAGSGQITLSQITFAPSSQSQSVGSGTLTLTNTSGQDLLVYLPYGTIFGSGSGSVLVWAVGQVAQAAPSATPEEAQPQPTDTVEVVEDTPTATPAETAATATPRSKKAPGASTPTTEATQEPSPTQATAPGRKSAATSTATSAPADTSTPVPTNTATQEPTSTATVAPPTAGTSSKPPTAKQNASADQYAPAAANDGSTAQNVAPSNGASTGSKATSNGQNNVQEPAGVSKSNGNSQAPTTGKEVSDGTSEQAAPAQIAASSEGSKVEALAPVVTITNIPKPVGTSASGDSAAVPPAVQTSGTTPVVPPVQTTNPTVRPGSTGQPTSVRTGTPGTSPTTRPTNTTTIPTPVSTPNNVPTKQVAPTEALPDVPTKEPVPPEPTRLTDIQPTATAEVPVIVTDPGGAGAAGGQGGVQVGSDSGTAPAVNPRTGAGPSSLPLLLSISSLALVLCGLQLRRFASKQYKHHQHR
jgi:hypothetical protein